MEAMLIGLAAYIYMTAFPVAFALFLILKGNLGDQLDKKGKRRLYGIYFFGFVSWILSMVVVDFFFDA